jgi:hypothetical protein
MVKWIAHFPGGSQVAETDKTQYRNLDREHISAWDILFKGRLLIRLDLQSPNLRIFRRVRHQITDKGGKTQIHMFGYQNRITEAWNIFYIFSDGLILHASEFRDEHYMNPIIWNDWET